MKKEQEGQTAELGDSFDAAEKCCCNILIFNETFRQQFGKYTGEMYENIFASLYFIALKGLRKKGWDLVYVPAL